MRKIISMLVFILPALNILAQVQKIEIVGSVSGLILKTPIDINMQFKEIEFQFTSTSRFDFTGKSIDILNADGITSSGALLCKKFGRGNQSIPKDQNGNYRLRITSDHLIIECQGGVKVPNVFVLQVEGKQVAKFSLSPIQPVVNTAGNTEPITTTNTKPIITRNTDAVPSVTRNTHTNPTIQNPLDKKNSASLEINGVPLSIAASAGPVSIQNNGNAVSVSSGGITMSIPQNLVKNEEFKSGYLLYDAIYIDENLNSNDTSIKSSIKKILKSYDMKIDNYFLNSYLSGVLDSFYIKSKNIPESGPDVAFVGEALNAAGGIDVSTIADGLAKFIVKRTKEELSIAFFDRFKELISGNTPVAKDMQSIFPNTYETLMIIGEEIYQYQAYMEAIREAFKQDLSSLFLNTHLIIENHPAFFKAMPTFKAVLESGLYLADNIIRKKEHPAEALENLPDDLIKDLSPNLKASLQMIKLFSSSLKSNKNDGTYWASYTDIQKMFDGKDKRCLKIYLGLIEAKLKHTDIAFQGSKSLYNLSEKIDSGIQQLDEYKSYFKSLALQLQSFNDRLTSLSVNKADSVLTAQYHSVISNSNSTLQSVLDVEKIIFKSENLYLKDNTNHFFKILQTSSEMAMNVERKKYGAALIQLVHLLDISADQARKLKVNQADSVSSDLSHTLLKYGSFMAAVIAAKTSDEVADAIEVFALPAGSAMIKRESLCNISLNAYCGPFVSFDNISHTGLNLPANNKYFFNYGLTAPIGIAFSKGHSFFFFKAKHSWSSSAFISVIDIGALVAFRFADDSTAKVPTIRLKDILSPGIFYSLGIPKVPISLNLGYQLGPLLTEVTTTKNRYESSYNRFSFSICVDIPLLQIYNNPR